jgi:hypothetical protein
MANNQAAKTSKSSTRATGERAQPKSQPAARSQGGAQAVERDENYAAISVLYHALQGAETIDQYIGDAREAGDEELVSFFQETQAVYAERAAAAKRLLAERLGAEVDDEDDDEESEEEEEDED